MKGGLILYFAAAFPLVALIAGVGLVRGIRLMGRPLAALALIALALTTTVAWGGAAQRYRLRDNEPTYPLLPHLRSLAMDHVQHLTIAKRIADIVALTSEPNETLFGHPTIVAQVATNANRRVSGELADLAPRWIEMKQITPESIVEQIETDRVRYFVTPHWYYVKDPFFRAYLQRCYGPAQRFPRLAGGEGHGIPELLLLRHRDGSCR